MAQILRVGDLSGQEPFGTFNLEGGSTIYYVITPDLDDFVLMLYGHDAQGGLIDSRLFTKQEFEQMAWGNSPRQYWEGGETHVSF